ncbi:MAG TPA: S1 RNA-binding domain-containing protein [Phycisphaerae bacterium]|nr:S1 RNA-binding domain-containing protein [Phycisphaerae bacterium]
MSSENNSSGSGEPEEHKKFRPEQKLDPVLQRELDEALGDASLEDLLAAEEAGERASQSVEPGDEVRRGQVIAVEADYLFVDLGGFRQGILPTQQFADDPLPQVGDEIEVTVEGYDTDDELLVLSREGAVHAAAWDTLEVGQIVEGRVTGTNKGGLELDVNRIRAFMPTSQIDIGRVEDLSPYLNERLRCRVIDVDRRDENLVLSRRALLEQDAAEAREKLWGTLAEGQVLPGVVRTIMPYGAFVDIGGVDGLLHVRDLSYSRVDDPHEVVQEGQQVQVMVLGVDHEERKVALGLKQTLTDPWEGAEAKWPVDSIASGRVTRLAPFGAFVELTEGVEGLIPISELSLRRIRQPSEVVNVGDAVKVRVLNVDTERSRISLSLKRVQDDPWMGASVRWQAGSVVEGLVTRVAEFGAFVELTEGVEGLIHISELAEGHVRSVRDVVREGDTVQVKVVNVDEDAGRISLSIKQVDRLPEDTGLGPDAQGAAEPPPRKRKRPLKGGLD